MPNYRTNSSYHRTNQYTVPLDIAYNAKDSEYYHDSGKQDNLAKLPLAMAYVPWQIWGKTFEIDKVLNNGTLFPDLYKPFMGSGGYR